MKAVGYIGKLSGNFRKFLLVGPDKNWALFVDIKNPEY
jgi:hypothetical protein